MDTAATPEWLPSARTPEPLKHERGASPPGDGRASPPPNCAICLGPCQNKSFTDSCLHQFCFNCLLTWSKIKAECPLCKQTFKSIIHNVRSNHQYEEYLVEQRAEDAVVEPEQPRRFRYRTTITFPRSERSAIQSLLVRHVEGAPPPQPDAFTHRRAFRQTVYRHNLWARLLPDFTGRLRECTPSFFRLNEAQKYRLVPWLTRELDYLLTSNHGHVAYVLARVLDLLPVCSITSPEFQSALLPFLGDRTEHFLHELLCFASTPYDMLGYDRNVQYGPDPRLGANINHVISSTDSDSDSDVVMVAPQPSLPPQPAPQYVIPIETLSHSDTEDSSSEVIMTGYIKPPQDRTPEVVDLLASDSDVLVQENSPPPSTSRDHVPSASALVKLTLSRRTRPADSDSDEDFLPDPPNKRAKRDKRHHSQESASTTSTRRETPCPSPSTVSWHPTDTSSTTTVSLPRTWDSDCSGYTPPPVDIQKVIKSKRDERKKRKKKWRSRSPTLNEYVEENDRKRKKKLKKHKRRKEERKSRISERDRPGTSGTRTSRGDKERRLRSVVCSLPLSTSTADLPHKDVTSRVDSEPSTSNDTSAARQDSTSGEWVAGRRRIESSDDSEDNIPLNLTVCK